MLQSMAQTWHSGSPSQYGSSGGDVNRDGVSQVYSGTAQDGDEPPGQNVRPAVLNSSEKTSSHVSPV